MNFEQIGKNTYKLVQTTEWFTTLMYFLHEERKITELKFKIGTFTYDNDWTADIYCILQEDDKGLADIFFREVRYDYNKKGDIVWGHIIRLTDFCFGWDFGYSEININWYLIDDFRELLSTEEDDIFVAYYDEVHSDFW